MNSYNHLMTWLGTGRHLFATLAVIVALMILAVARDRRHR